MMMIFDKENLTNIQKSRYRYLQLWAEDQLRVDRWDTKEGVVSFQVRSLTDRARELDEADVYMLMSKPHEHLLLRGSCHKDKDIFKGCIYEK